MKAIHKFQIELVDEQKISLPRSFKFLHFALQNERMYMWGIVDLDSDGKMEKTIRLYPTGGEFEEIYQDDYIGTVLTSGGAFVWHVFME